MTRGETQTGHAFCERRRCLAVMTRGPFRAAEISNEYESSILLRKLGALCYSRNYDEA